MKVLFASTRGAGHFNPLVPLIGAALSEGHEATVAGPPPLAERVPPTGASFHRCEAPPEGPLGETWGRVQQASTQEEGERIVVGEIFGRLNVEAALPGMEEVCRDWRPDLVLRDPSEFASAMAAEAAGITHARVSIGLHSVEREMTAIATPEIDDRRPGTSDAIARSPYLTMFPESFELSGSAGPPATHRFRDPSLDERPASLGDWWPEDDRPLVYLSFGSVAGTLPTAPSLYRDALAAAARFPARVLVTVGNEIELEALGEPASNVRVERWVPQADVLPEASLVVCHGGSGTTLGTLSAGLPLVIVPLFADQGPNAERAEELGIGIAVQPLREIPGAALPSGIDAEALAEAVHHALGEPRLAARARELASEISALPPPEAVLRELLRSP